MKSNMRSGSRFAGAVVISLVGVWLLLGAPALAEDLHVDALTTIQQALAYAHQLPPDHWVTILVEPGHYAGPVVIDRPRTRLIAQSPPLFNQGKLVGHNPAVFIDPPALFPLGTVGITA